MFLTHSKTVRVIVAITATAMLGWHAEAARAAGCSWSVAPSGNAGSLVNDLGGVSADSATDAWAVGFYNISSTDTGALAEHWNGATWKVVPTRTASTVQTVFYHVKAITPTNVWAVGYYQTATNLVEPLIEHWNGTAWSITPSPNAPAVNGGILVDIAANTANDVWAVGSQFGPSNKIFTFIEHWNGTRWSVVPSPNPNSVSQQLVAVVAISPTNVWAGGWSTPAGTDRTMALHWNGAAWSIVLTPNVGPLRNHIESMSALSATGVFAVGFRRNPTLSGPATLAEGWNGSSWQIQSSPNDGSLTTAFGGTAASVSEGALAVGLANQTTGLQFQVPFAAVWNGTKWVTSNPLPVAFGTYGSFLNGASTIPGTHDFWAVGSVFDSAANFHQGLIELFDCP